MQLENTLREASENYLEAILTLEDETRLVRSIDVASALGVSRPSVNKAIGVLKKAGMVEQQPYGRITLTDEGRMQAMDVMRRHHMIKTFLVSMLGVDENTADTDACKMEHAISDQTMKKLTNYIEKNMHKK